MNTFDERRGLPSASNFERLLNCPGSWALEQSAPEPEESSEATAGTAIHSWLAGDIGDDSLSAEELDIAVTCRRLETEAFLAWVGEETATTYREERLWLRDGLRLIFSGKPDFLAVNMIGGSAMLLDFKSGFVDVAESAQNAQLRALAVLVADNYPVDTVTVGVIQPGAGHKVKLATFSDEQLTAATAQVLAAIDESKSPITTLCIGSWCRYCRANAAGTCPAMRESSLALAKCATTTQPHQLTNNELGEVLDKAGVLAKFVAAVQSEAKRRIEAGERVTFESSEWVLEPGSGKRKITDPEKALTSLLEVSTGEFLSCCTVRIGDLEKAYHKALQAEGKVTVLAAKNKLNAALAGCMEKELSAPTLERVPLRITEGAQQ